MPTWEGIEDAASVPTRIWLWRLNENEVWKPLRKADCRALNATPSLPTYIEGGRATAYPVDGSIKFNFDSTPCRELTSATWFIKQPDSNKKEKFVLVPMSDHDACQTESLYQDAVAATSSLGKGIDAVLKQERLLQDPQYKIQVVKSGGTLQVKKKPTGWFGTSYDLQRGYGHYESPGEEEEEALGSVRHVIFVIHGIGEAMWSRDDVGITSHVSGINTTRTAIQKKQYTEWQKACERARKSNQNEPPPPNRIELLPIEWFDEIHSSSNTIKQSLQATTIQSIPALRAIANDVIFDVLMYMTPTFCQQVLKAVTTKINHLYEILQQVHPDFENGGKCSLVGFSLGSVIAWDLLSISKEVSESKANGDSCLNNDSEPVGYQAYATMDDDEDAKAKNGSWGPPTKMTQVIPFQPEFTIFLGSPVGLFLTLRGAHAVFDQLRQVAVLEAAKQASQASEEEHNSTTGDEDDAVFTFPVASPFTLPSDAIYNIFHPSDPVAYRIEPLLLPEGTNQSGIPAPLYLTKQGQGVRLHLKAKQLGDDIRRSFAETTNMWSSMITTMTEQAVSALSKAAAEGDSDRESGGGTAHLRPAELTFPLGGKSERVDYQLQPGVIDNEYVSAVTAHASYFSNSDVMDFLIELTSCSSKSSAVVKQDNSEAANGNVKVPSEAIVAENKIDELLESKVAPSLANNGDEKESLAAEGRINELLEY